MTDWTERSMVDRGSRSVEGVRAIRGSVLVPGDKSVSHRALILGALAKGVTRVSNLSEGDDVWRTTAAMRALGVPLERSGTSAVITGTGNELQEPVLPLDLGNSGTAMRLLTGVVSGRPFLTVLFGDRSLSSRPMDRVLTPLRTMGAELIARRDNFAPVVSMPSRVHGISYPLPVPSAQVKSAVLLAGRQARETTTVVESTRTRTHTEDMLAEFGANVTVSGTEISVEPGPLRGVDMQVPGDPSQAAFWMVAAAILGDSHIELPNVGRWPERTRFVDVLRRMGASITDTGDGYQVVYSGRLAATSVAAHEVPSLVDELPVLAVAAAAADGQSSFLGVGELRHKESDRLSGIVGLVESLGARCAVRGDDVFIDGVPEFTPFRSHSAGDHRMAMSAAVAALNASGTSTVDDVTCIDTSYPMFFNHFEQVVQP